MEQILFLDSTNASSKNLTTGSAQFNLEYPISVPSNISYLTLIDFYFLNEFDNITVALSNNKIYYTNDSGDLTKYSITIPDGMYTVTELNNYLQDAQLSQAPNLTIFSIVPNYSTGRISIVFDGTNTGYFVNFEDGECPHELLGFENKDVVPDPAVMAGGSTADYFELGPNRASFNNVNRVKVSTNLTAQAVSDTKYSGVLASAPITSAPLEYQFYEPRHLVSQLIIVGGSVQHIFINLYDENDNALEVKDEFSVTLKIFTK